MALSKVVPTTKTQGGKIAKALGSIAAGISALKGHQGTLYALSANAEAAAARVTDTDFARSSADLAKFSILNQSAMAMVSQANQANAAVLAVLQYINTNTIIKLKKETKVFSLLFFCLFFSSKKKPTN